MGDALIPLVPITGAKLRLFRFFLFQLRYFYVTVFEKRMFCQHLLRGFVYAAEGCNVEGKVWERG